ncbi:MAG: hypothetical protein JWM32_2462 [Verrucomicrobia bacterium]|nr:hypothetical protein [Verrucomicrobiota bacterium]
MKKYLVLLALSLAANAALVLTFFVRPRSQPVEIARGVAGSVTVNDTSSAPNLSPADTAAIKRVGELLVGSDLRSTVARLRAAGFPPALIRAIVQAQVAEQFRVRREAIFAEEARAPFWKNNQFWGNTRAYSDLTKEQNALTKELLGADAAPDEFPQHLVAQRMFGNLSPEKLDRIQAISRDYGDLRSQITTESRGMMLPEDREKMALLQKEERADLVKLLTPAELEEYDLRNSSTSFRLRYQLSAFNPTEEEFRTLFRLNQASENATASSNGGPGAATRAAQQAAQAQLQAQIAAALGPARAAEYQQSTNPAYMEVNRLLARLDLPSTIAPQVVAVQQDIQERANTVRRDSTLTPEARAGQLAALNQEAETKLTSALGTRGYNAYRSMSGGWINGLTPQVLPPGSFPAIRLPGG